MSNKATSSGIQTSSGAIVDGPGTLKSVLVGADGTNAATVIIYDNGSAASGTELAKVVVDAGATHEELIDLCVVANNGIYLSISGTGAEAIIHYELG